MRSVETAETSTSGQHYRLPRLIVRGRAEETCENYLQIFKAVNWAAAPPHRRTAASLRGRAQARNLEQGSRLLRARRKMKGRGAFSWRWLPDTPDAVSCIWKCNACTI